MDRRWRSDGETVLDDLTSNKIKIFIECLSISHGNPNLIRYFVTERLIHESHVRFPY